MGLGWGCPIDCFSFIPLWDCIVKCIWLNPFWYSAHFSLRGCVHLLSYALPLSWGLRPETQEITPKSPPALPGQGPHLHPTYFPGTDFWHSCLCRLWWDHSAESGYQLLGFHRVEVHSCLHLGRVCVEQLVIFSQGLWAFQWICTLEFHCSGSMARPCCNTRCLTTYGNSWLAQWFIENLVKPQHNTNCRFTKQLRRKCITKDSEVVPRVKTLKT